MRRKRTRNTNFFGDSHFAKIKFVLGENLHVGGSPVNNAFLQFTMNDFNVTEMDHPGLLAFGDTPGIRFLGREFQHYRIRGLKIKSTMYTPTLPGEPSEALTIPLVHFHDASGVNPAASTAQGTEFVTPYNVSTLTKGRFARYRTMSNSQFGGKPSIKTSYYRIKDLISPGDRLSSTSKDLVGSTDISLPASNFFAANTVEKLCVARIGVCTLNGGNMPGTLQIPLKLELTAYVNFFGKRSYNWQETFVDSAS